MLFVTMVYVIQWSSDKLGLRRKWQNYKILRRTDEEKKKIKISKKKGRVDSAKWDGSYSYSVKVNGALKRMSRL